MSVLQPPFPTQTIRGGRDFPHESVYADYLATGSTITLFDVQAAIVVDHLMVGASDSQVEVEVAFRGAIPGLRRAKQFGYNLGGLEWVTLDHIRVGGSGEMIPQRWVPDASGTTGAFLVRLREAMHLPFGGRVQVRNGTGSPVWVSTKVAYREL